MSKWIRIITNSKTNPFVNNEVDMVRLDQVVGIKLETATQCHQEGRLLSIFLKDSPSLYLWSATETYLIDRAADAFYELIDVDYQDAILECWTEGGELKDKRLKKTPSSAIETKEQ